MVTAVELGLLYAIMALGVYLTFRILEFADLTVDGSFTTGAAVVAVAIVKGYDPILATAAAFVAGLMAGAVTGILHTKANIDGLLAGILTQIGLYSINLRIMGGANKPLLGEDTLLSPLRAQGLTGTWTSVGIFAAGTLIVLGLVVWFLHTDIGLGMQATGNSEAMARSFGVPTDTYKVLGLALSNGLVGLCGAVVAQHQGFADISMGVGLIIAGLASVILGQAILGTRTILVAAFAVVFGAVLYRVSIQLAMNVGLEPNDMKLASAVLVVLALVLPQWQLFRKVPGLRAAQRSASGSHAGTGA